MLLPLALLIAQITPAPVAPAQCGRAQSSLLGWSDTAGSPTIGRAFVVPAGDPATIRGLRVGEIARPGNAALVPFEIAQDATYRVALSDKAWVDVVTGRAVIKSSAHAHGPACSGIVKMVDFPLKRGRYTLHITGLAAPNIRVLIAKV